jgi:hypothetical protein
MKITQLDEDVHVKAMREHARTLGITELLLDCRREHLSVQLALESSRARIAQALVLLGAASPEPKANQ